jgi:hypothetical protein
VTNKRRKSAANSCNEEVESLMSVDSSARPVGGRKVPFVRCHSESELMIMTALSHNDTHNDLIGDFSRAHCLPLVVNSKHPDLKTISAETVSTPENDIDILGAVGSCIFHMFIAFYCFL